MLQYGDYIIYCVRGNHDISPESLNYNLVWDYDVNGWVYVDPWHPSRIKYFPMVSYYNINHYIIGVIGGSFSVDKQYRIANNMKWFSDEQLTESQLEQMVENMSNKYFDIILTHTCPISWQPTDLFLPQINQDLVDKTTETYLQKLADKDNWGNWLWGHFHDDRDYRDDRRHMIMDKFKTLEEIVKF